MDPYTKINFLWTKDLIMEENLDNLETLAAKPFYLLPAALYCQASQTLPKDSLTTDRMRSAAGLMGSSCIVLSTLATSSMSLGFFTS